MKKNILTIAFAGAMSAAIAQGPILVWEENLGGTSSDVATSVSKTPDGGSIVAGYTYSTNGDVIGHISGADVWVTKLSESGTVEWKRIYGGSGDDFAYSIIRDTDGNYVFAGTSNSSNGDIAANLGAFDMWIVKLDASGNVLFSKTLGGSDDDAAFSLVQTSDKGYAMAGETKSDIIAGIANKGGYDAYIAKVNNAGTTVFQRLIGGSDDESMKSIAQTSKGDLYAAGETESNNFDVSGNKGGYDFFVTRLQKTGNLVWAKTYGGTTNDNAHSIVAVGKSVVIAGETESNNGDVPANNGSDDFWVLKLNATGTIAFSKVFGGETSDIARSIINTSTGLVVVGETESASGDVGENYGNDDYWFVKLNNSGTLQYEQVYGGAITDIAYDVAQLQDGNFILVGASQSENVDVTENNGNDDFWVVKLDNPDAKLATTATEAIGLQAYPNPTVNNIVLTSVVEMNNITITDMTGKVVFDLQLNNTMANINMSELANGIYFVSTRKVDGGIETIKVIKQ